MPVILPASRWQEWLDPANHDLDALTGLLVPAPDDLLTMHPVSTEVNNVRNRGEQLIAPLDPSPGDEARSDEPPSLFG
jgi:putative SOS response-associated peptidase YedK